MSVPLCAGAIQVLPVTIGTTFRALGVLISPPFPAVSLPMHRSYLAIALLCAICLLSAFLATSDGTLVNAAPAKGKTGQQGEGRIRKGGIEGHVQAE